MNSFFKKLASGVLTAMLLLGCAASGPKPVPGSPGAPVELARPRLIALLVIDGLPQRQLDGYRDQFGPDGFARFMQHGVWFANAHFDHAHTVTAAGHAVLLSGATHGSPYEYDTHVPLMLWGPRWLGAAALADRVGIVDLAPTLARWLQIAAPADSEGRILPLPAP